MKRIIRPVIAVMIIILTLSTSGLAQRPFASSSVYTGPNLIPSWTKGDVSDYAGKSHILVSDFDQDGKIDIVTCSGAYLNGGHLYFLNYMGDGTYDTTYYSDQIYCKKIASGDRDSDGTSEIYIATYKGGVEIFDPISYKIIDSFVPSSVIVINDMAVGDVDNDGEVEIVLVSSDATRVYDALSHELEWQATGYGGTGVDIGNIDSDPQEEIVVNSSPAHILNATNKTQKWSYPNGFGIAFDLGDVDGDNMDEISYTMERDGAFVIEGDTHTEKWSVPGPILLNAITVADVDSDGLGEVILGDGGDYGENVTGYRGIDGTYLWTITGTVAKVNGIAAGDVDDNGVSEIFWGAEPNEYVNAVFVGDWAAPAVDWQSESWRYPVIAAGDTDNDGCGEFIRGSWYGNLVVFDGETRQIKWSVHPDPNFLINHILIGQLDGDPAPEILLGGSDANNYNLRSYDGISHSAEWQDKIAAGMPDAVALNDINSDGIDEIFMGALAMVTVFHGASDVMLWQSDAYTGSILDLSIGDIDGDGYQDLAVLTTKGIYIYNTYTWLQTFYKPTELGERLAISEADSYSSGKLFVILSDGNTKYSLQAWDGVDHSVIWQYPVGDATILHLESLDINTDGSNEIIVTGYQGEYDDEASLLWIGSQEYPFFWEYKLKEKWGVIRSIALSDIDNDSMSEFLFASNDVIQIDEIGVKNNYLTNFPLVKRACLPLFVDDFSNPSSGWPNEDTGTVRYAYENGEYSILVRPTYYIGAASPGLQAIDYDLSIDIRNLSGAAGSYGLIFGLSNDWSYFYTFEIYVNGNYGVYAYQPQNIYTLIEGFSPYINQGGANNHLVIVRSGNSLKTYANGYQIANITAFAYPNENYIGLIASTRNKNNVTIHFDNFVLNPPGCSGSSASNGDLDLRQPALTSPIYEADFLR
jgi:hypothetical protein